jgi:hypothetical protein
MLAPSTVTFGQEERRIAIGESISISVADQENLSATRKGILSMIHVRNGQWRLTGLRSGFVVISGNESKKSFHIWVYDRRKVKSVRTPPIAKSFPKWICEIPGIVCNGYLIGGMTNNKSVHAKIKEACQLASRCLFDVKFGTPIQIAAHVYLLRGSSTDTRGVGAKLALTHDPLTLLSEKISNNWQDDFGATEIQSIGEPSMYLFPGAEATVNTGGEFPTSTSNGDHPKVSWKSHGLSITMKFSPYKNRVIFLDYDITLKHRTNGGALQTNQLAGRLVLDPGETKLAGQVDIIEEEKQSSGSSFLKDIPIIGPLFSTRAEGRNSTKLLVLLTHK